MSGFAHIPILNMYAKDTYIKIIPTRNPKISANPPMINGTIAPPIIPVQRIPENDP